MFQRRHYQFVVDVLKRQYPYKEGADRSTKYYVEVERWVNEFKAFPNFDENKFRTAAQVLG